jgi:hypothetical protein
VAVNKKDKVKKAIVQDKKKTSKIIAKKATEKKINTKPKTSRQMVDEKGWLLGKNPVKKDLNTGEFENYNSLQQWSVRNYSDKGIYGRGKSGNKIDKASRKRIK